ncbi:avidin-like isoform X1 [Ambystoma mexicanum]|uniref:avidin-like isoform X1 n=1 Tax=Ambystoma mexicanum TaxID=8296 RepID=UPI0037E7B9A0
MGKKCCLAVLALLLSLSSPSQAECNLMGTWTNELGSNMTISSVNSVGIFSGVYTTAVSATNNTIVPSPLTGHVQKSDSPTLGFTVSWAFSASTTSWAGQCYQDPEGRKILATMWLLREEAEDSWKGTRVGQDVFFHV